MDAAVLHSTLFAGATEVEVAGGSDASGCSTSPWELSTLCRERRSWPALTSRRAGSGRDRRLPAGSGSVDSEVGVPGAAGGDDRVQLPQDRRADHGLRPGSR